MVPEGTALTCESQQGGSHSRDGSGGRGRKAGTAIVVASGARCACVLPWTGLESVFWCEEKPCLPEISGDHGREGRCLFLDCEIGISLKLRDY